MHAETILFLNHRIAFSGATCSLLPPWEPRALHPRCRGQLTCGRSGDRAALLPRALWDLRSGWRQLLSGPGVEGREPLALSLVVLFLAPFLHCILTSFDMSQLNPIFLQRLLCSAVWVSWGRHHLCLGVLHCHYAGGKFRYSNYQLTSKGTYKIKPALWFILC